MLIQQITHEWSLLDYGLACMSLKQCSDHKNIELWLGSWRNNKSSVAVIYHAELPNDHFSKPVLDLTLSIWIDSQLLPKFIWQEPFSYMHSLSSKLWTVIITLTVLHHHRRRQQNLFFSVYPATTRLLSQSSRFHRKPALPNSFHLRVSASLFDMAHKSEVNI